jgi:hypothetical protein
MKKVLPWLSLLLLGCFAVQANDVLVYRHTSPRPWSQYECANPDGVSGSVPKTKLTGTEVVKEYWVLDQTSMSLQVFRYYTTQYRGVAVKEFSVSAISDLNKLGIRQPRWIATNVAGQFTLCIADGLTNPLSAGFADSFERVMTGLAKPYTVAPGIVIPKVAVSLAGEHVASERSEALNLSTVTNRRLVFETGTQALALDVALTKAVHTTGTVPERSTLDYAAAKVRAALLAQGYDEAIRAR